MNLLKHAPDAYINSISTVIANTPTCYANPSAAPASGSSMVKVRVQHPAEASVKIHQVLKVGYGPNGREHSETVTWSSGLSGSRTSVVQGGRSEAEPPSRVQSAKVQSQPAKVQAQTLRGKGTYTEASGFKYCFRDVRNGQVRPCRAGPFQEYLSIGWD